MIEMSWLGISLFAGFITIINLLDARETWHANRDSTEARILQAWSNFRREVVRLVLAFACIVIIIPPLGRNGDTALSPYVLAAMLIPVGIALNSFLDRRDRLRIEALLV